MKESQNNALNGNFLCGVVEGFYGRPWTADQRKLLFKRMNKFGLNTYLYAPKDDAKHRAFWRDLYSVEEAENLTSLITAAESCGITFIYALSPGLDLTFSSSKEVSCLKRKLQQVATFGCKAFSLLFDDIEPEMNEADKEVFQSFAHAQVSVTNETFQHLNQPVFLFCPTEYCASRAVPNVKDSGYLNTIGAKLLPGVQILWTGPKVVSKKISIQSIQDISKVLHRSPVLWDNYHANDYDQKRIFLGPYDGRSTQLIPQLGGVLSNPNCEYEANFIALHTLAQWSQSKPIESSKDTVAENDSITSDIRLETEIDDDDDVDAVSPVPGAYQPKLALNVAIRDWMEEFYRQRTADNRTVSLHKIVPPCPGVPSASQITTCMSVTPTTTSTTVGAKTLIVPPISAITNQIVGDMPANFDSYIQPSMSNQPVNSLLGPPCADADIDSIESDTDSKEPMECVPTTDNEDIKTDNEYFKEEKDTDSDQMQIDTDDADKLSEASVGNSGIKSEDRLTHEDIQLLVDLFYLPFEHGSKGIHLLQEFYWLKTNANIVTENRKNQEQSNEKISEWFSRATAFENTVKDVGRMADRLFKIPNRALLYDLHPYLWDMRGILSLLNSFVKWLGIGAVPAISVCYFTRRYTWCSKEHKSAFMSGDQEPWMFRGGLTAEFQRMLPIDGAHDLFTNTPPEKPSPKVYTIRPYLPVDESAVYNVCRQTCDDGFDGTEVFPNHPELMGDRLIGGILTTSPEYSFIVEDGEGICGYALAALDAKTCLKKIDVAWIPAMCIKYPKPDKTLALTPAEEIMMSFYKESNESIPVSLYTEYPSLLKMDILPERIDDAMVAKRLLACVLSALKSNGSSGVHCELQTGDQHMINFFSRLGLFALPSHDTVIVGRKI